MRAAAAFALALGTLACGGPEAAAPPVTKTVLQSAVDGLLAAFKTHRVVAIGDSHGLPQQAQQMELYAAILRDPRFAREVGNLVVEFGAGGRQHVVDRYVAGETVPYVELRTVWTDTVGLFTAGQVVIARFFAEVRAINRTLPAGERIRVWLGEPPIDWPAVDSPGPLRSAMRKRDSHPAGIVEQILARREKALVIYGSMHFIERDSVFSRWFPSLGGTSIRRLVEARHPGALFLVLPYSDGLRPAPCARLREQAALNWPTPVLAAPAEGGVPDPALRGCATIDEADLVARGLLTLSGVKPSKVLGDAVLFLDPAKDAALSPMLPDMFLDAGYRREVSRRFELRQGQSLKEFEASSRRATARSFSLRKADYEVDLDTPGYAELLDEMFARHDRNRDGVVTADEYTDPIQR